METMAESVVKRIRSKDLQAKVLKLLEEKGKEERQDNDEMLCSAFWAEQSKDLKTDITKVTALHFLKMYAEGQFTSADDITRARRIVQNRNPHVQGTKWNQRHGAGEDVRENINTPEPIPVQNDNSTT